MRILTARVPDYGPLTGVELDLAGGLNVVYGPNEAGKTSLLDFLLSHLFRWEDRRGTRTETVLDGLGRFGAPEEGGGGRIELRLDGRVYRYPGEGPSLLHELELEYAGLTGLFCVRSGEMELPEKEEGAFWAELKKVLSGLPEGVETLRGNAHEAAGLTRRTGQISDAGSPGRKTRLEQLRRRAETLEDLTGRLDEISELAEEISRLEERAERLERARDARIAGLHDELTELRQRLDRAPDVAREPLERWERLAEERRRIERELEEARDRAEEARSAAEARREELEERERRREELDGRLRETREAELESRARRLEGAARSGLLVHLADPLYWAGALVLLVAVGFVFFTPSDTLARPVRLLVLGTALATGAGLFFGGRELRRRREATAEEHAALLEDAAARGLDADAPEEVPPAVRRLESAVHQAETQTEGARARAESAEQRLEERVAEAEAKARRMAEIEEEIRGLREELGFEALEEARARAEERRELEERVEQIEAELQGLAGRDESAWEVPRPEADDLPDWSASAYQEVEDRLRRLRRRHRELQRDFDRAGLAEPEDALSELQRCRAEIREIELDRDAGRLAGEVFATMDETLEERLSEALRREDDHSVQALLHRVTGRYVELRRDGREGGLVVRDEQGREFPLRLLSRGARDQAYLALRLGLAGAALEAAGLDEPGFFLLDDAFLTADWGRRERMVAASADLADAGWQVVYLTCDRHLRELFTDAGARLHEL